MVKSPPIVLVLLDTKEKRAGSSEISSWPLPANINSLNAATAIPGCCAVSWQPSMGSIWRGRKDDDDIQLILPTFYFLLLAGETSLKGSPLHTHPPPAHFLPTDIFIFCTDYNFPGFHLCFWIPFFVNHRIDMITLAGGHTHHKRAQRGDGSPDKTTMESGGITAPPWKKQVQQFL